ncbi:MULTISPECIES: dihydroneopterin aldolase [Allobacillus]|uniref:7,8-dihydroneopterin aldolase n=1 Tax=Allobacillus salarius TaxID=1955272 RepID=A0A556P6V7_9BACI|nr:dihydroneopterin aldolase [Allobacillus salarius]TSJ60120.1 dihydroneopterin aldolase [Allobacillus salarius]
MDKIKVNQMMFYGYHGLFAEENKLGQRFNVDVELMGDFRKAGQTDRMEDSIDYGKVYEVTKGIMEGKAHNLLESLAESIAQSMFESFSLLDVISVYIDKPGPPIPGYYQSVGVEVTRKRSDYEA